MSKRKILVQLDSDVQPSVFDAVVAIDSDVDHLLRHAGVEVAAVRDLVYGAMFMRGGDDLRSTAIFIGGSDVAAGEAILTAVEKAFFGPVRVSVMLDSNGANTTAAAAVIAAGKHLALKGAQAAVLGGTGPVGSRVVRLLALEGAEVTVVSRSRHRAEVVCRAVGEKIAGAKLTPAEAISHDQTAAAINGAKLVIAAGAPGIELLSQRAARA